MIIVGELINASRKDIGLYLKGDVKVEVGPKQFMKIQ